MTTRPRVVLTHWVHPEVTALLAERCEVVPNDTRESLPRAELIARARDAQALMAFMPDRIDDAFLAACPSLRVVAGALKGYDNFDVDACVRRGVWFTVVPDLLTVPTAELAVGLLLALARRIPEGDALVRSGRFSGWRPILYGTGLAGRTIGIVGMGAVGRAVARRLASFEARLVYADPAEILEGEASGARRMALDELVAGSDVVLLCVPLTPATLHLVDARAIERMRQRALIVNVGRGSVVDEAAVAAALGTGRLGGYAADVFEFEDWARADRPREIPASLLGARDRTVFTPHLGSAVDDARREIALWAARSILEALGGQVPRGAMRTSTCTSTSA